MISFHLAVPRYLEIYLTSLYGSDYKVTTNDDLGILILNTLKKKTYYYSHSSKSDVRDKFFTVKMSLSMFEKYGCTLSEEQLCQIVKSIEYTFRKNMYTNAIIMKEYHGIAYKDSISSFLTAYKISEDDLSYGTIRKDFNRKKSGLESNLRLRGQIK